MKNVLVSGYIGFDNFGDEAIFYALSTHLKAYGFNVSVLCTNKEKVREKYKVKTYNFKKPLQILKAILKNDILISGGGSLLQNKTSNFSLFYYLFIIFLAKIFSKKVIIFAQGFEPIFGAFEQFVTKKILKTVDFISVRDENSKKLLKSWNIDSTLVSDPVYSLAENIEPFPLKDDLIVQLRSFKGIDKEFIKNLASSIARYYDGKISVFSFQDEIDERVCFELMQELKNRGTNAQYIPNKSIEETIDIINKTKYVISTRLHGLIISNALKSNVFALSYDEKVKTLMDELNLDGIDIHNYTQSELDSKLCAFFELQTPNSRPYRKFEWGCIDYELNKNKEKIC